MKLLTEASEPLLKSWQQVLNITSYHANISYTFYTYYNAFICFR